MLTGTARQFASWLTERHYSPATVACYVGYVQRAERAVGALEAASADGLYDWWTTLPTSSSSRNGGRKALIAFYKSIGARTGGPAVELPVLAAPDGRPRPVGPDAFTRLRGAAARLGGVHAAVAVLFATTGCRFSEARKARWDQFDLEGGSWRIVGKGRRQRGPKLREVPLHPTAVAVLADWRWGCGSQVWVFPSVVNPQRPVSEQTMRRRVYAIAREAGVGERVNPHRWRHTFATAALESGNLAAVQDVLGHADPATTRRYAAVGFDRMRQAVDAAANYGSPGLYAVG